MSREIPNEVSEWYRRIGSKGRAAQLASTTHEERSARARKGALKYWRARRKQKDEKISGQATSA